MTSAQVTTLLNLAGVAVCFMFLGPIIGSIALVLTFIKN